MVANLYATEERARFLLRFGYQAVENAIKLKADPLAFLQLPLSYLSLPFRFRTHCRGGLLLGLPRCCKIVLQYRSFPSTSAGPEMEGLLSPCRLFTVISLTGWLGCSAGSIRI